MASDEMEEVIVEFLAESKDGLDRVDDDLLALEKNPGERTHLASIFRAVHTIKGTAGFLAYERLQGFAHTAESLLSLLRDGERSFDAGVAEALFAAVDALREMLAQVEQTRTDGTKDYSKLTARLEALTVPDGAAPTPAAPEPPPPPISRPTPAPVMAEVAAPSAPAVAPAPAPAKETPAAAAGDAAGDHEGARAAEGAAKPGATTANESVRVDVGLLDRLMNLVGELVLARNQVLQVGSRYQDQTFLATSQRLNLITSELQESVMRTRMQPIGNVLTKFPRMVRDLAGACKKRVRVEMEGEKTELDRTLLEAIRDPLTHIVRNSIDHGIETPEVRLQRGKPAEGTLWIRAFHEGGQVTIEVVDDGGGINSRKVREKAISRGLITAEQAERMTESELTNLIFLPGFSTAEAVSNISGRGVGMDVVRTNVEKAGGSVDLHSVFERGLTIRIRLPLTLAIIPALVVGQDDERYAIPQVNLLEIVRIDGADAKKAIETLHSTPVYRLRGNLLPLLFLREVLAEGGAGNTTGPLAEERSVNIVVLSADDRIFGLVVDRVMDTSEIVVKPLGKHFKGVTLFAGATIMGDGAVALILDSAGLSSHIQARRQREAVARDATTVRRQADESASALLVCEVGENRRVAVPLASVDRLEEFTPERLEHLGSEEVVQYRGDLLHLIDLSDVVGGGGWGGAREAGSSVQVVACRSAGKRVGFKVGRIVDVVESAGPPDPRTARSGTLGSVVVGGKLVEVVDTAQFGAVAPSGSSSLEANP